MARICMVLNNFELPFGGPELQAQKVAAALMARGHQIFIIAKGSGKAPKQEVVNELRIIRLNRRGLASVELFWQLFNYKSDFDIIHVHGVGRLASVAIRFAKWFHKKVFIKVTTAGHVIKQSNSRIKALAQKIMPFREQKLKLLQQADGVIAISNEIRNELEYNGFAKQSIYNIPNGVDTAIYHPVCSETKSSLRSKLRLPIDKRIFVYTGKLTRRKGIDTLLATWCKTTHAKTAGMLVMIGSGQGQQDNMEACIQESVKKYCLEDSVLTLGNVDNVADYLQAADIFVFPSRREGLPNSLLEAMACGLLCVASDIGGNRDLIVSGKNGFLVPVEDVVQWCDQIESAADNVESCLMEAAATTISDNYDLRVTVDRLEKLFNR
ncbi:Putative teichuronic acid biosynthesis glycosyltransferase TuaC [Sporomusa ovata DSM 2662]|uniref:Glycosyltransferase n=1 Tax=Sporomusa ovata TaxID=2378 RepID=A0A0U1KT10_9FIRM|nr:glycosyltransferase family 4 protein [Sporomusa ovata]EQB26472.1 glycosyltransferase [Sporomusa ovata DSM 2662]CQR70556.1 Glycosyltransferase [Sporomusa ovata]